MVDDAERVGEQDPPAGSRISLSRISLAFIRRAIMLRLSRRLRTHVGDNKPQITTINERQPNRELLQ